ncbi:MAG: hypothetical protein ACRYG7_50050 [Janthinobacterium lividum]
MLVGPLENISSDRHLVEHCSLRFDIPYFLSYEVDEALPYPTLPYPSIDHQPHPPAPTLLPSLRVCLTTSLPSAWPLG